MLKVDLYWFCEKKDEPNGNSRSFYQYRTKQDFLFFLQRDQANNLRMRKERVKWSRISWSHFV